MKTLLIEYVLKPEASVAEVEREIATFVRGIRELGLGIRYTSHRRPNVERGYVHVGQFPGDASVKVLQAAPFFDPFTAVLRASCAEPPRTTWLEVVASSEAEE